MDNSALRDDMVDGLEHSLELLPKVVSVAMHSIPRHKFVTDSPYQNRPTERRDTDTTVLAPTTVTRLLAALDLQPDDEVLVVDTGVGHTAAVLVEIVGDARVHAVDITRSLIYETRENLQHADCGGALVDCRDGTEGLTDYAPFDRILIEASVVRPPARLLAQLTDGGRFVMPKGVGEQTFVAIGGSEMAESFGPLPFKPLLVDDEQTGSVVRSRTRREDPEYENRGWHAGYSWEQDWIDWSDSG